jgi:hypothetical protein
MLGLFTVVITAFRGVVSLIWPDHRRSNWADNPSERPFQSLLMPISLEKNSFCGFPMITIGTETADSLMPRAYFEERGRRLSVLCQPMSGPIRLTSGRQAVPIPVGLRQPMSAQPANGASERSECHELF